MINGLIPHYVLKRRVERFQSLLQEKGIDAAMVRVLSTFIYFTGVKWLRPSLLIPSEGEPVAFVASGEEDGFRELTWVDEVMTYREGGDLMGKVSGLLRQRKYKVVGIEFGLERDAYILFYEMFKRLNPRVKVVDISPITSSMRMIKDEFELRAMREAGRVASRVMDKALELIEPGLTETEIAGEILRMLYAAGCEEPLVYVNAGPHPRIHAEPLSRVKVKPDTFVTVVIGADRERYYVNKARTVFVGEPSGLAERAVKCMDEVYHASIEGTSPGRQFSHVIGDLDKIYERYGMLEYRVIGYSHGVGLQVEEPPITTIVPKDRFLSPKPGMALAMVHAPILLKGLGQVKKEDTFIVGEDGSLEQIT